MKERIIAISLLLLAGLTIWAIAAELPKKNYAQPSNDFTEAVRSGNPAADQTPPASAAPGSTSTVPSISSEVIRLHILADSDSERDQAIKLALRDTLLPYLNAATMDVSSKEEAMQQLREQCPALTELANTALSLLGADYSATVSIEQLYFPIRIYGSQTYLSEDAVIFPPGYYDSVQITLGSGEGHNWWCLAYPSLCFIDSTYDYVPKDSELYKLKIGTLPQSSLKELFYGEPIREIPKSSGSIFTPSAKNTEDSDGTTVFFSFKLWELIKSLFKKNVK